jgi:hypothetical protein
VGETLSLFGEWPNHSFSTTVHPTNASVWHLHRAFCIALILRLSDKSLIEVCESLTDIYKWQIKNDGALPSLVPQSTTFPTLPVVATEAAPFPYDDQVRTF